MQHQTSIFRLGLTIFFAALIVLGVVAFSTYRGGSTPSKELGSVEIWGTFDQGAFDRYLQFSQNLYEALANVRYRQFNESTFHLDILEALASGQSPDLLFIKDQDLHRYLNKIFTITADRYPRSLYEDNFVDGANIFMQNGGIVALPLASDPLVMLWNRDLFASAGIARPPESWRDFFELTERLSVVVDDSITINQSAISFGETTNVDHFKSIIVTLLLQLGNPIVTYDNNGRPRAILEGDQNTESAHQAVRFYTEFSDPSTSVYSWNRSMPDSENAFLSGRLAVYFAPISTIGSLRLKNPNLNFAVAEIPSVASDGSGSIRKSVYAPLYGFVIPRVSPNLSGAFQAATLLTENGPMREFTTYNNVAPVRRDLIQETSQEVFQDIIKRESLYGRSFLDPDPVESNEVFQRMVEYITSGQRSIDDAVYQSSAELTRLLNE